MKRILFVMLMLISSLGIVAQVRYYVSFQTFGNYSFSGTKVYIESATAGLDTDDIEFHEYAKYAAKLGIVAN